MAKKNKSSKASKSQGGKKIKEFLKSDGFRKLRGSLYILLAIYLFLAVLSFFCNGCPIDDTTHNWVGKVGGWLAIKFTASSLGIGAIGVILLMIVVGIKLWGKKPDLIKTVWVTLFWMVWFATFFGYIAGHWLGNDWTLETPMDSYAGRLGYFLSHGLFGLISWFTFVILVFAAVAFLIFVHHVRIKVDIAKWKERMAARAKKRELRRAEAAKRKAAKLEAAKLKATASHTTLEATANPKDENVIDLQPHHSPNTDDVPFTIAGEENGANDDFALFADLAKTAMNAQPDSPDAIHLDHEVSSPQQPQNVDDNVDLTIVEKAPEVLSTLPEATDEPTTSTDFEVSDDDYSRHFGVNDLYDPHLDLGDYKMPDTDLLEDWEVRNTKVTKEELIANKDRIVATLKDYGIEIVEIAASPGPTVTLYEIKPAPGIRISKIKSLEDDIALSLAAAGIRIIAPIPGRGTIGIEVPNTNPQIVSMKTMLECDAFKNNKKMELPIALGKTISNDPYVTDLAKMPHLLMAGATGTGKSVGLNAVIASLLYKKHPSELKFVMVDPKKVELSIYNKIERHYLAKLPDSEEAIITDVKKVVRTLNSLCIEMDHRYDLLKQAGVRKITEYNDKFIHRHLNPENGHMYLPYIVLVIDEFADLIMTAGKEVEAPICRLAQLARAVGIHLIIATQRPTTNIITGTIKANFPARIAFKVTSGIDSRTILDTSGAQRLIGRGDMLISLSGSDLVRLQCALMETSECEKLSDFIGQQRGYPDGFLLPEYLDENDEPTKDFDPKQKDDFFDDAARLVVASQFGSTSLLQRKLSLGYNRAGRIMDQLEAAGIVGPYNGSKAREVLIRDEVELEDRLKTL